MTSIQNSSDFLEKLELTEDVLELEDKRRAATASLAQFVRDGWHVLEPGVELVWNWHIDLICAHLEAITRGEITRLLINIPPGHMKSLIIAVFWPAWVWLDNPNWRAMFGSYDLALSTRDNVKCRDLIRSDWYQNTFKPKWKMKVDQNVKGHFENTGRGLRQALSTSPTAKGTGFRGDCVAFDDPHNVKEHPTDEELTGIHFWNDKRMSSRLNNMKTGVRIGIMQRVHENDLSGHILKKGGWVHVCLPTEFDPDRKCKTKWGEDPRKKPGELLFPEMFPQDVIDEAKEDLGPYDFEGQHNQNPSPPGGGIIKQQWFRFWYPPDCEKPKRFCTKLEDGSLHWHEQVELPEDFDAQVQSWDMTFKSKSKTPKKKPDFVAGQVWGKFRKKRFLLDQVCDRMSFTEAVAAVIKLSELWPMSDLKLVEDAANGPAIMDTLEEDIGGFEPVTPKGGKEARAHAAAHTIRAGYVYLPHPDIFPWVKELLHQVCVFPRGRNDDMLDALTQIINHAREMKVSVLEALTR